MRGNPLQLMLVKLSGNKEGLVFLWKNERAGEGGAVSGMGGK